MTIEEKLKEVTKNLEGVYIYYYENNDIIPCSEEKKELLTKENFCVIVRVDGEIHYCSVEDIFYDEDDLDFVFKKDGEEIGDYFYRSNLSEELCEFLDNAIKEREENE